MSISTGLRWVVMLGCLLLAADSIAQSDFSRHNWYFGNTTRAIRFSRSDNTPSLLNNKAIPFGQGGSAVATNPVNGDLLFYTDGQNVYDVTYPNRGFVMLNGNLGALAGAPRNQPVAVSPVPGSDTQYYIFRNDALFTTGGTIRVSTVDMSLSGNELAPEPVAGAVMTPKNVAITGLAGRSEAMITVPHADGINFWLITHTNGTDEYVATLIDGTGSFTPTLSNAGLPISAANFSYHAATGKLAVSPQSANSNVAILNFNNTDGSITFDRFVLNSGVNSTVDQAIYDTEWSPTGRFLYISIQGQPGITADVVQFDMTAPPSNSLVSVLSVPVSRSYGLKLAPDSAIYHLYQTATPGSFLLGRFTDVDSVAAQVIHTPDAFGGTLNFNGQQFPEFLPPGDAGLTLSFTTAGSCTNYPVSFFPSVTPAADSLQWSFGDGEVSSDWSPVHTYVSGTPPSVNVRLTAYLNGQSEFVEQTVSITNFTLELTVPTDTTACRCEFPPPVGTACNDGPFSVEAKTEGANGTVSFQWSNGDTGATLTPDSAGYYYVLATDATAGCVAHAGVNVREYDAQDQRANFWYFGEGAGIDFNEQPPVAIADRLGSDNILSPVPIHSPEGVSVISDRNGQVVFSTDGVRVYDRNDDVIELSPGVPVEIGGQNGASQSALIVPVPGDETLYYIFTTQEVHGTNTYELRYSLYDIKQNDNVLDNGDGGLVTYNQLLFTRSTERITSDGRWLVAHEFGNNSFRAYEISAAGIGNPVISSIGSDHRLNETGNQGLMGQGYMKLNGTRLAVALPDPPDNFIELFDFVDSTGVVTNFRRLDLEADEGQVYGIEFSGNKIFASVRGTTESFIREAYISFQGIPVLVPGSENSAGYPVELGAIQQGPDGTIYVAINGPSAADRGFLGIFNVAADTLQLSDLNERGFPLAAGTESQLGLPNFVQEIFTGTPGPSMSVTGLCAGSPSEFQAVGTDPIDEFLWTYDGGFTSTEQSFSYTFSTPGSKTVTVRITNRCGLDTLLTQTIVISPPPPDPTFLPPGQQPVVCNGPLTLQALDTNDPALTYLWSTGETTYTIQVNRPQNIGLIITNAAGCTSTGETSVVDNRPVLDLGPDQEICQNTAVAPLDAENPGLDYAWEINGTPSGTSRTQVVSTAAPGTFKYWVEVSDDITTCWVRDSVVFTINPAPVFTATASPIACGATNGQLQLQITAPATGAFIYSVNGLNTGASQTGTTPATTVTIPGLSVDTYLVDVTEQVTGCEASTSVGLNSSNISITNLIAQTPRCEAVALEFDVNASGATAWTYRVINATTGAEVVPPTSTGPMPASIITPLVPVPGVYTVEVLDNSVNACTASETITVNSDPLIIATLDYVVCPLITLTTTVTSPPADIAYSWTGPNVINVNAPSTTVTAQPAPGVHRYEVELTGTGFCATTYFVDVTVNTANVTFTQSDPCANTVTLTADVVPAGNYTYIWYQGVTPITPSGRSIQVTTAENGQSFSVEAISTVSGCSFTSGPQTVNVFGEIVVSMQPVSPCRGEIFSIDANVIPGATYQWFFKARGTTGPLTLIPGQTGSTLTGRTLEGTYQVVATRNGCSDELTQEIEFVDDPDGGLPTRRYICNRPENTACSLAPPLNSTCTFTLEAAFGVSWQWYRANEAGGPRSPLSGQTSRRLTVTAPGVYSVDIVGPSGCTTTDETEVIERCQPEFTLPNVFRPGSNQEVNQTFSVYPFQTFVSPEGFEIFIYNRWGEMVYQSNDLQFKWNGMYKGSGSQLLPGGTYTYVIKYFGSLTDAGRQELRGSVLLLR